MQPDPADHLALIHRVIDQMGIKGDLAEEAFSESLVIITKASQTYNPNKNVPVANWLAIKMKWSLKKWLWAQHRNANIPIRDPFVNLDMLMELNDAISLAKKILTKEEYFCVMASALGYQGRELARRLNTSEIQISRIKKRARAKLIDKEN